MPQTVASLVSSPMRSEVLQSLELHARESVSSGMKSTAESCLRPNRKWIEIKSNQIYVPPQTSSMSLTSLIRLQSSLDSLNALQGIFLRMRPF
jgi:hypothetical protein